MAWLLVRGLLREQGHWGRFKPKFERAFSSENIYTIDVPGNGEHWRQKSPSSISKMVDCLRLSLNEKRRINGDDSPLKLLGLSMGGMIVADWILSYPCEIKRAVLINASMNGVSPIYERFRPANLVPLLSFPVMSPEKRESLILDIVSNSPLDRVQNLGLWKQLAVKNPISLNNSVRQLLAASKFKLPLVKPRVPTLILCSEKDRLVSRRCSLALAEQWDTSVSIHPSAGHDLPMDDPEWVINRVAIHD